MTNKPVIRDVQCADNVAEMVSLGRFDKEFIAYGTAVQEQDGKIYYYATSNEKKLQKLAEDARQQERYFTPIVSLTKRSAVPSGMEEAIMQVLKHYLLGEMRHAYEDVDYFALMQPFFAKSANDNAYPLLRSYQEQLEGHFEDGALQLFLGTIKIAHAAKVLTESHYQELLHWHQDIRQQMEDDPMVIDHIERTLYGFVYYEDQTYKVAYDAQEIFIIHQHHDKIMQGLSAGPILHKTYCFGQFKEIHDIRKQFCQWLLDDQNERYFHLLAQIKAVPGVIDKNAIAEVTARMTNSPLASAACLYYDRLWNKR